MRKTISITIDEKIIDRLRQIKNKDGIPISRSLEHAFREVDKCDFS